MDATTARPTTGARLRRAGGIAGIVAAGTFVVGFAMALTVLADYAAGDLGPAASAAYVAGHEGELTVWYLVIYVLFGVALVPLVLAVHDRLADAAPDLARPATVFGLLWVGLVVASGMIATVSLETVAGLQSSDPAAAVAAWSAIDAVQNGLGGGVEVVGGAWVLLVGVAGLRTGVLPRGLCVLGLVAGTAAVVTVVPALEAVGAVFGLAMIVWFVWSGLVLLRTGRAPARLVRAATA